MAGHSGKEFFASGYLLTFGAWLASGVLILALHLRLTPLGTHYTELSFRYLYYAFYYDLLGTFLVSAPFLATWLILYRRPLEARRWRWLQALHIFALALNLFLNQVDHELMRFMGCHLSISFLLTYVTFSASENVIGHSILIDQGGVGLPFVLGFGVPLLFLGWARRSRSKPHRRLGALPRWCACIALALPIVAPAIGRHKSTALWRIAKVQPVLLTFWDDFLAGLADFTPPPQLEAQIALSQRQWLEESADPAWRFPDPERPFLREPTDGPRTPEPWNVIYLQLETFRGWNMGLTRPDLDRSPTPFLDSLARESGAWWSRAMSFGQPTVDGMISGHCSITPHSFRYIVTSFPYMSLYSLPQALRKHGWRAEVFTGADPDWDGQTPWLRRWYDRHWAMRTSDDEDRPVFRQAARRILELGGSGQPFMATVISITNHSPFTSREPALDLTDSPAIRDRILNTMHYTDDVVREFVETLSKQPWWDRTLLIVVGDHGFNFGEHDGVAWNRSLYRESVWIPLIVHGRHPRLPLGRHDEVASLLDVAPTVADLLGVREPNPWQGHSLASGERPNAALAFVKGDAVFSEAANLSVVFEPVVGHPQAYDPLEDPLQERDISSLRLAEVDAMLERSRSTALLNNYLIRANRIWK